MTSAKPIFLRILAISATAAVKSGQIIREVRTGGQLDIVEKGKDDFQTVADRSSEKCIVASLKRQFPNLEIIGEEGQSLDNVQKEWIVENSDQEILSIKCPQQYENIAMEDIVVWVDPLDGTTEFTRGFVEFVTVLIGVAVKGRPVGGIIHQPFYKDAANDQKIGRTLWGIVGYGVGGFNPIPPSKKTLIAAVTTRTPPNETLQKALDALKPDEILGVSGVGSKTVHLLEGKAHVYIYPNQRLMKWDTCAPEAILSAIGGRLTDLHGKDYSYNKTVERKNKGGVFVTRNGADHETLIARIPEEIKRSLV